MAIHSDAFLQLVETVEHQEHEIIALRRRADRYEAHGKATIALFQFLSVILAERRVISRDDLAVALQTMIAAYRQQGACAESVEFVSAVQKSFLRGQSADTPH